MVWTPLGGGHRSRTSASSLPQDGVDAAASSFVQASEDRLPSPRSGPAVALFLDALGRRSILPMEASFIFLWPDIDGYARM